MFSGHLDHKKVPKMFRAGFKSPPPYGRVKQEGELYAAHLRSAENRLALAESLVHPLQSLRFYLNFLFQHFCVFKFKEKNQTLLVCKSNKL